MALVDRVAVALQPGQLRVIPRHFGNVLLPLNIEGDMLCFCFRSLRGAWVETGEKQCTRSALT